MFWLITHLKTYASLSMDWRAESKYHGIFVKDGRVICPLVEERLNGKPFTIDGFDGSTFWFHSADGWGLKTVRVGDEGVRIEYWVQGGGELEILPYLSSRSIYTTNSEKFPAEVQELGHGVKVKLDRELMIRGGVFRRDESWMTLNYEYDRQRGESWTDIVFRPGAFLTELTGGENLLDFSIMAGATEKFGARQRVKRGGLSTIWRNCDSFIRGDRIVAGYYWFEEWGRDSLISLPGLTLVKERPKSCFRLLARLAKEEKNGLIPNFISDGIGYNSVDAPLWFIDRVFQLYKMTRSKKVLGHFSPTISSILANYLEGTDFGIREDHGLLDHDPQVTWMDAMVDGEPVTPRRKAVEVQALWYNGLMVSSKISNVLGEKRGSDDLKERALKAKESFNGSFPTRAYLKDSEGREEIRPNQIFAISLEHPVLERDLWDGVMRTIIGELFTPYGLRSLAPRERGFRALYEGDLRSRDLSYHNGPVWPWLIGPFIDAYLRTYGRDNFSAHILDRLLAEDNRACYGYIPELYDPLPPYRPRGAIAQAWSMAEVLRGAKELGLV
jgi:hypothetical protein